MFAARGLVERGVSYCIYCERSVRWKTRRDFGERKETRTDAMNNPKAPPSAKPITPDTAVLPGQDSISFCICQETIVSINHYSEHPSISSSFLGLGSLSNHDRESSSRWIEK